MNKGFTLIGLLVMLGILMVLSFVVVNLLSKVSNLSKDTKDTNCKVELETRAKVFPKECLSFLKDYLNNK